MRAVMSFSQRVVVLVSGKKIADGDAARRDPQSGSGEGLSWPIASPSRTSTPATASVRVIEDVSFDVDSGETVVLLGTNGNGKSTLMKCIMGIVPPSAGTIIAEIDGVKHDLVGRTTEEIVDLGIALVPEGRRLFPRLTVEENLLLGAFRRSARAADEAQISISASRRFPRLAERRRQLAGSMSGGEQQMLALARALMLAPKILLVDEPSVGLAPILVSRTIDDDQAAEGAVSAHRADGRAELHPGDPHRRPRLRHRARQDRVRRPLGRRTQQQRSDPQILYGDVNSRHPEVPARGAGLEG